MKILSRFLLAITFIAVYIELYASQNIPDSCKAKLNENSSGWKLAGISSEVESWAALKKINPVVAEGDFDGNNMMDTGLLVSIDNKRKVGVCFKFQEYTKFIEIQEPYCSDYVFVSKAKSKHYNYDTKKHEYLINDGISVACFERAGATYVYEGSGFRMIVDSD